MSPDAVRGFIPASAEFGRVVTGLDSSQLGTGPCPLRCSRGPAHRTIGLDAVLCCAKPFNTQYIDRKEPSD